MAKSIAVIQCRERARRVYYVAVFEIKKEIPAKRSLISIQEAYSTYGVRSPLVSKRSRYERGAKHDEQAVFEFTTGSQISRASWMKLSRHFPEAGFWIVSAVMPTNPRNRRSRLGRDKSPHACQKFFVVAPKAPSNVIHYGSGGAPATIVSSRLFVPTLPRDRETASEGGFVRFLIDRLELHCAPFTTRVNRP